MKPLSFFSRASQFLVIGGLSLSFLHSVAAEPLRVVIVAAVDENPLLDKDSDPPILAVEIGAHLQELLNGSPAYSGSVVTVMRGAKSLVTFNNSFSFAMPARAELNTLIANDYDVAILINNDKTMMQLPSLAFEGVARVTDRLLKKGADVYLLEPDYSTVKLSAQETAYRIANGCGINVIPAAETLRQSHAPNTSNTPLKGYIMSGSIYSKITGSGIDTGNSYEPSVVTDAQRAALESTVFNTIASEKAAVHYTSNFNGQGGVIHRPLDITQAPFNGVVKFAHVGSSTENQIQLSIKAIIDDTFRVAGQTTLSYVQNKLATNPKEITNVFNNAGVLTNTANKDQYLFAYGRGQFDSIELVITSNQSNLLALPYARHSDSSSINASFSNWDKRADSQMLSIRTKDGSIIPSFSIYARNFEFYPDSLFLYDGTHLTTDHINGVSTAYLASAVGIDFDKDEFNRFKYYRKTDPYFTGWNTVMQQAYLSEDRAFMPDSDLEVVTSALPVASTASPLDISLTASGGTGPFTWEETTGNLPMGVDLHPDGKLQGNSLDSGGSYQLIFKVTDSLGAIRKQALELNTTGYGVDTELYGWDTGYYFDTSALPNLITGTVITALNGGGSAVTIDGITFTAHDLGGGEKATYSGNITSTGNNDYDELLSSFSEGLTNEAVIRLTGLTAGETYTLQVFYNNKTDATGLASQLHAEIDGNGEVILKASHSAVANDDYGSYGVANFIASGSEVNLTLKARSETHSIQGKVAFNGLLLTKPNTVATHEGVSRHAKIDWSTPINVTGVEDFISGIPVYALNGGHNDYTFDNVGMTFTATNIGKTSNIQTSATNALADADFAQLMSIQTVTDYFHSFTFEGLTIGKEYKFQIFNKSRPLSDYQSLANGSPYRGSDTFFGLPNQGAAHIFADGEIKQSVGTFTATSTSQVLEMNANEENMIKDIAFSALYLVEINGYEEWIKRNGGPADQSFTDDSDNDGVVNLIEYALNGDPSTKDSSILPTVVKDVGGFKFSFERNVDSLVDTTVVFQYSSSLLADEWTDVEMNAAEVTIGGESGGMQPVEVMINEAAAVDEKLFGRIKVTYDE